MDLKMLMEQDSPAHDDYRRVLRERLGAAGKALMEEVGHPLERSWRLLRTIPDTRKTRSEGFEG